MRRKKKNMSPSYGLIIFKVLLASSFALVDSEQNYVSPSSSDGSDGGGGAVHALKSSMDSSDVSGDPSSRGRQCSRILNLLYGVAEAYQPKMW